MLGCFEFAFFTLVEHIVLLAAHITVANTYELMNVVEPRGRLHIAKNVIPLTSATFQARNLAVYLDKNVYTVAVEGVLNTNARQVCIQKILSA